MADIRAAAARWARTWADAWEAGNPEPIVALYAPYATVSTQAFREPYRGPDGVRDYVTRVLSEEEDQRVWMSEPIVDGDRASISWWASLREEGADATLAGTSVLRFDAAGLVAEQWDAWNVLDARSEPPTTWSPFADRRDRAG
jgi:predicted SnoaL-like aldol condensation-catalyzing enzyme